MDRVILHCDCNCFFASVEATLDPILNTRAFAVCGDPELRHGIVLAKNEAAKKAGVKTGEAIWQAKQKCPRLQIVAPHYRLYKEYSEKIFGIYNRYTDLVEPYGIDECWLDVTGSVHLFGSGEKIANELRQVIRREVGVTISAGASFNKIFAKMGSDYKKPDATTVLTRENFRDLLYPLPAGDLFMVGRHTADKLRTLGIRTVGQLADADENALRRLLGVNGSTLWRYANGYDYSPVVPAGARPPWKSIGNGATFRHDLTDAEQVRTCVFFLCDKVAARLRKHGVECSAITVAIRDTALNNITRSAQLPYPTDLSFDLRAAALALIAANVNPAREPIRALSVCGTKLLKNEEICEQISLFDLGYHLKREREQKLEAVGDTIRHRYGLGTLTRCSLLQNDYGL